MEDPNEASSTQTATSEEQCIDSSNDVETSSQHGTDALKTKAIEVNSADEVRQAIKAVLFGKPAQMQNEEIDPVKPTIKESDEIQVNIPQEYKPESGDQLLIPKPGKRKRRGRPQKAGPSKRFKRVTVEDFYVGKLSNVVAFPSNYNANNLESDSNESIYTAYSPNQWLRMRFYKRDLRR